MRLLIDVLPEVGVAGTYSTIETILAPLFEDLAKNRGISDWRMVEYGKGKAYITAYLTERKDLPETVLLSSRSGFYDVVREVLVPRASEVLKGVIG
jgi:hypothetical protein